MKALKYFCYGILTYFLCTFLAGTVLYIGDSSSKAFIALGILQGIVILLFIVYLLYHFKYVFHYRSYTKLQHIDEDDLLPRLEKACYSMIHTSNFVIVISTIWLAFAIGLINSDYPAEHFTLLLWNFIASILSFIIACVAQYFAMKFHNKQFPYKKYRFFSAEPDESYFQGLDEGEKYEAYRTAHIVVRKMMLVFTVIFLFTICYSYLVSFNVFATVLVGILWFAMLVLYFKEGRKQYVES